MATAKQKAAARKNIKKAQSAQKKTARGTRSTSKTSRRSTSLSTAAKNDLPASKFAFPDERKEPLTDAKHVRNASPASIRSKV